MFKRSENGYSLAELLTVIAILGMVIAVTVPALGRIQRRAALRAAAGELRAIFHLARSRAISRSANCGVKFTSVDGEWRYALYDDGDRDGVRNDDIASGVDVRVSAPRRALSESDAVTIGLLPVTIIDPDGDRVRPAASPVRFNRSAICSFSPLGESTPGTIYLTDRESELYAVRVYGASAKMRTLRYDVRSQKWIAR